MRMCSGCQTKVEDSVRFCDACKAERGTPEPDGIKQHTVSDRVRYAFLYSHRRWHAQIRPRALRKHPFCSRCQIAVSEIIDHIVPAGEAIRQAQESGRFPFDKWAGFFLLINLCGLCRKCHAVKTEEDKAHIGAWPSVIEANDAAPKKRWSF